jgi:hypothetical protein
LQTVTENFIKKPYILYLDPSISGARMMNPNFMEDDELRSVFTDQNEWKFVPHDEAQVCNLLRFETMRSDKVSIDVRETTVVAGGICC